MKIRNSRILLFNETQVIIVHSETIDTVMCLGFGTLHLLSVFSRWICCPYIFANSGQYILAGQIQSYLPIF